MGCERLGCPPAGMGTNSVEARSKPAALFGHPAETNLGWRRAPKPVSVPAAQNPKPTSQTQKESSMKGTEDTRKIDRYIALDIHKEYVLAAAPTPARPFVPPPAHILCGV